MLKFSRALIVFSSLLLMSFAAFAQDLELPIAPWSGFGITVNPLAGKVYKHEQKFTLPIPALTTGVDLNFFLHTYGKKEWEQRRHYPTIGIGLAYINYGIDSVYGQCIGLYPNIEFTLLKRKNLEWTLRIGDGIGYVTRRFQRTAPVDTINNAVGSRINDFVMLSTDLRYHINKHWDVQLGAHLNHISNGSYHKPNLGVNTYGGHLGVNYFPVTPRPRHIVRELKPLRNRILIQARLSIAYVSSYTAGGPLYPVYLASGYLSRRWHSHNKIFAGLDYSYHTDIYSFLRNNEILTGSERKHAFKSAVFVGNEFLLGRVGVVLQVGYYLNQFYLAKDPIYEKIGGHYYLVQKENGPIKEFFISAFLKTHKTVAELGELGIGFGF